MAAIPVLLFLPLAISGVLLPVQSIRLNAFAIYAFSLVHLAGSVSLAVRPESMGRFFAVDPLNVFFLLLLSVLNFGISVYHGKFVRHSGLDARRHTFYACFLLLFLFSLTGLILSTHLGLMWVFLEATTLAGAPFLYIEGKRAALEATWKYVFICSIGIALGFVGILLLSIGLPPLVTLFFDDLASSARSIHPFWLGLAFPFVAVGFGTKAGLAPVHTWLPDAHAEAPSPISAMFSGVLLNTAFLGILRVYRVMIQAGQGEMAGVVLMAMGLLSVFVGAVFIPRSRNFKRLLAFSSVENMGIAALGAGIGGLGMTAAMLQLASHSLCKAACFLTAGNIVHRYRTKEIDGVRGLLRSDPQSGWLWLAGLAALAAFPPSPAFLGEYLLVAAMIAKGWWWMVALFGALLAVILYGMARAFLHMSFGTPPEAACHPDHPAANIAPQVLFFFVAAVAGCWCWAPLADIFKGAAGYFASR